MGPNAVRIQIPRYPIGLATWSVLLSTRADRGNGGWDSVILPYIHPAASDARVSWRFESTCFDRVGNLCASLHL